ASRRAHTAPRRRRAAVSARTRRLGARSRRRSPGCTSWVFVCAGVARAGDGSVLTHGYDSLPAVARGRQLLVCTALWTVCEDTPLALCTAWGVSCENSPRPGLMMLLTCNNAMHSLCAEKRLPPKIHR